MTYYKYILKPYDGSLYKVDPTKKKIYHWYVSNWIDIFNDANPEHYNILIAGFGQKDRFKRLGRNELFLELL